MHLVCLSGLVYCTAESEWGQRVGIESNAISSNAFVVSVGNESTVLVMVLALA